MQVIRGKVAVNGQQLGTGDALGLAQESMLKISDGENAEVLVFELA